MARLSDVNVSFKVMVLIDGVNDTVEGNLLLCPVVQLPKFPLDHALVPH